jgi:hypothetical protein
MITTEEVLKLVNTLKIECKATSQNMSVFIDNRLTPDEIDLILSGDKRMFTEENAELVSKSILIASKDYLGNLCKKSQV